MVEEVRVPSEPDGKDVVKEEDPKGPVKVVKEEDTQGQGPVKVRHDHPIFKSVDDGDMERLQNYLEVIVLSCMISKSTGKCGKSM